MLISTATAPRKRSGGWGKSGRACPDAQSGLRSDILQIPEDLGEIFRIHVLKYPKPTLCREVGEVALNAVNAIASRRDRDHSREVIGHPGAGA